MGPIASIAQVLKDYGPTGVSALCIGAMIVLFNRLNNLQEQRIADRDKHVAELGVAHEAETAALKLTIPLSEKLAVAVGLLEAKNRRRADAPRPLGEVSK